MRITSCHLAAFGHFRDKQFNDFDHALVVVQGSNEAGKSTFRCFLQTMLYGIYPVDANQHPYATRGGNLIEGSLTFRLFNSAAGEVARRLFNQSLQGSLHGETNLDLRNRTLPAIDHIPQRVFEEVYALTLKEMKAIEPSAWGQVQDRLLGGMSIDYVRPARQVVEALEGEAKKLWRTDRRSTEAKELEGQLRELREEARDARDNDEALRILHDEVEALNAKIAELEEEKIQVKARIHKMKRLAPVRKELLRIETLQAEAGDIEKYADLPREPVERLASLKEQIEELESRIRDGETLEETAQQTIAAVTPQDERVVEHAAQIRTWIRKAEAHETKLAQLDQIRMEMNLRQEQAKERAQGLLSVRWNEGLVPPVRDLSLADLKHHVRQYEEAAAKLASAKAQERAITQNRGEEKSLTPSLAVAAVGVFLILAWLATSVGWLGILGLAAACIGGLQAYNAKVHNDRLATQLQPLDLTELEKQVKQHSNAVVDLLYGIPIPSERASNPDYHLLGEIQSLRDAVEDYDSYNRQVKEGAKQINAEKAEVIELVNICGLEPTSSVAEMVSDLEAQLKESEERVREAEEAQAQLEDWGRKKEEAVRDLDEQIQEKQSIEEKLETLGEGEIEHGIQVLHSRRTASLKAHDFQEALQRDQPDLDDLRREIEETETGKEKWRFSDEEIVRLDERLEHIQEDLREQDTTRVEKENALENLQQSCTTDIVESKIAHTQSILEDVKRERDRLILLANIVKRADHDYRMEHQPDVIRLASAYLKQITEGRYEQLALQEGSDELLVFEQKEKFPLRVGEPLSQGTLDQIYLAIRLAIIDHLDESQERLPVFLDEVFVNWDSCRREHAYQILREMTKKRQIFLFTCHSWLAEELEKNVEAHRLILN